MTPEAWTVVGTGIVILMAIATSNRQHRRDMNGLRGELRGEMKELRGDINGLRERMARLKGLLDGLREALTGAELARGPREPTRHAG